ncbi:MAG: hypothetical protein GWN87_25315, partial [Desulfuromonadales bacterium]|nr:hypothetical protein [Desulfuromonadales bacterium]NIS43127.1 hypothetical protein [Desulfuromonadales bacterium]
GGEWTAYAPFTLAGLPDGVHVIGFRSTDNVENMETEKVLTVVVDNTPPVTVIEVGEP